MFSGAKRNLKFFFENTEKLHKTFFTKILFFQFFEPEKVKKTVFFRAKIWVEFECKYMKVGNRLLLAILCFASDLQKKQKYVNDVMNKQL